VPAYDTFDGEAACPSCGDRHWFSEKTEFFLPLGDARAFRSGGVWHEISVARAELDDRSWLGWWRVRDPRPRAAQIAVLDKLEHLRRCSCGTRLATVLDFELAGDVARLAGLRLLDADAPDVAAEIDFARLPEHAPFPSQEDIAALLRSPAPARADYLRGLFARCFDDRRGGRIHAIGPTSCDACGDTRERDLATELGAFFRTEGTLFLGARLPFAEPLDDDRDRDFHLRLRTALPAGRLAILGARRAMGCRCGAGPARLVARFVRRPAEVELVELSLRVVRRAADLDDLDYAHGLTRAHGDRAQLIASLVEAG
jgi:hypothetical protein